MSHQTRFWYLKTNTSELEWQVSYVFVEEVWNMVAGLSTTLSFGVSAPVLQNKDLRLLKSTRFSEKYGRFFG